MKKEKILEKINSYNGSIVRFSFILHPKSEYFSYKSMNYEDDFKKSGISDKEIYEQTPLMLRLDDIVHVYIFTNSTMTEIETSFNTLDSVLAAWRIDCEDFFYLKENFNNFDKKEKRFLKAVSLISVTG